MLLVPRGRADAEREPTQNKCGPPRCSWFQATSRFSHQSALQLFSSSLAIFTCMQLAPERLKTLLRCNLHAEIIVSRVRSNEEAQM